MPISATEKRIPGGFTIENATVLGHAALNGDFCLISYLPGVIRFGDPVERIINRYVLFIDGSKYPDNTVFTYNWTIDYLTETGAVLNSYEESDPLKLLGIYDFNSKNIDLDLELLPGFKKLRIKCRVSVGAAATEVLLEHAIEPVFQDITDLHAQNSLIDQLLARAGNPYATHVSANFFRDYFQYAPKWGDAYFDLPMNIPLSIFYHRVARSGRKKNIYRKINADYYEALNADLLELFRQNRKNLVGPCSTAPHFLSMTLEKTPFTRTGADGLPPDEEDLFENYNSLAEVEKTDIYNYARFPKSNFLICALMLENLMTKAQENQCSNYIGESDEKATWSDLEPGDLPDEPDFIRNLLDEYTDGPQTAIEKIDYRKSIGRVHKHFWSGYIEQILKFSYADKSAAPRIADAYFARKVVTESANGELSVSFERIDESKLLYQEYIVIETANLRNQGIECSVRTGDAILTGAAKKSLQLIFGGNSMKNYVGLVGSTAAFDADHGAGEYVNLDTFADKAVIKLGFRPPDQQTYDKWDQNLRNSSGKKSRLEIKVQPFDRGTFVYYGPEKDDEEAVNSAFSFLTEEEGGFKVTYLDKANQPRIKSARIRKKVVTGTQNLSVDFEDVALTPLGRQVYIVAESVHLAAGQAMDFILRTYETTITGLDKQALPLMSGGVQRKRFSAAKGNTDALMRQDGQAPPYTNLNSFAEKAVAKLELRPQSRVLFDTWAQNIANGFPAFEVMAHAVQPPSNDLYVFYGEEKFEEVASNSGGSPNADELVTFENRVVHEIFSSSNEFNYLPQGFVLGKIANDAADHRMRYYYHDLYDNEHIFGDFQTIQTRRWIRKGVLSNDPNDLVELVDRNDFAEYNHNGVHINFMTDNSDRDFINPECFAGLLGAMARMNIFDLGFNGFSNSNGDPGVSSSHLNGVAGDLRYLRTDHNGGPVLLQDALFDYDRQVEFNNALFDFGWARTTEMLSERFQRDGQTLLLPHTIHYHKVLDNGTVVRHDNHLHVQGFDTNTVHEING